jgi:hypothetical protein
MARSIPHRFPDEDRKKGLPPWRHPLLPLEPMVLMHHVEVR